MADDEDEGGFGGMYENGHWVWDEQTEALKFVSDLPPIQMENLPKHSKAPTGAIEFRDDIDLIEQLRYRRRYQRKLTPGQSDVITLQDIKDIALYTAPMSILSPLLINLLHTPTTERFLRALILFCGYYLQTADEMATRMLDVATKVRTPICEKIENVYHDNLADLRILVAKEYCVMIIGGADVKRFHHMGAQKKRQSLTDKDSRLFETLLRISVQIVWLALGRRSFNQIELEVHRIFKSEIFNFVEHALKTGYISKMLPEERAVLLGRCLRRDKKLNTRSPLLNEVTCDRPVDYSLLGLGVIKYPKLTTRMEYLHRLVAGPEDTFLQAGVTLGIIGLSHSGFDTMLRPINQAPEKSKSKVSMSTQSTQQSGGSMKSSVKVPQMLYPPIIIPQKDPIEMDFPPTFPSEAEKPLPVNDIQHKRWLHRIIKLITCYTHSIPNSSMMFKKS